MKFVLTLDFKNEFSLNWVLITIYIFRVMKEAFACGVMRSTVDNAIKKAESSQGKSEALFLLSLFSKKMWDPTDLGKGLATFIWSKKISILDSGPTTIDLSRPLGFMPL